MPTEVQLVLIDKYHLLPLDQHPTKSFSVPGNWDIDHRSLVGSLDHSEGGGDAGAGDAGEILDPLLR